MSSNSLKHFDKNTRKILFVWYFSVTVSSNIDNHPIRAGEGEKGDGGMGDGGDLEKVRNWESEKMEKLETWRSNRVSACPGAT